MIGFREVVRDFYATIGERTLPLGMGGATVGGYADETTLARFQATLEGAHAAGVRYYDTSAMYGGSEFRFGTFLRGIERSSVFVATKSPIPAALTPTEAAFFVRQAIRNSSERLGLDAIDLFQVHDVETLAQVLAPGGILDVLLEARQAGTIRYFGLATRFHDLLETAARHGAFDTILTYADYTPIGTPAAEVIALAQAQGVGVINGSPLAFGLLTGQDPRSNPRIQGEWKHYRGRAVKLYDFCAARGLSVLSVALQFPMLQSAISMTLTGPGSPEELQAGLDACRHEIPAAVWRELHTELGVPLPPSLHTGPKDT